MIKVNGEKLKQWDIDRTAEVAVRSGRTLETIRFWRSIAVDPLTVAFTEEDGKHIVNIPNILLMDFGVITIEAVTVDQSGTFYSEKATFTVRKAKKPDNYEYRETPTLELGSGGGSWNDLTDKPFYEETTPGINIEWDGNMEGHIVVAGASDDPAVYVKVSEQILTDEQLIGATIVTPQHNVDQSVVFTQEIYDQMAGMGGVTDAYTMAQTALIVRTPCVVGNYAFDEPGVYFVYSQVFEQYTKSLTKPGTTVIHKLDEKYLPETAATKEYVEEVILGGAW